jgi:hypothetical protein
MAHTTCLVCLVSTVSGHRKNTEKQALVAGTKQSNPAMRAVSAAYMFVFVLCLLLAPFLKWTFHKLTCVKQSTFLRYQ